MFYKIAAAVLAAGSLNAAITQPVKVEGGLVSGVPATDAAIMAFRGIPFAAPPVADLRWRAPKPVVAWQGVRAADKFSASCIQNVVRERKPWTYEFMTHGAISEDCLYLNVWTAAKSPAEKRPVYVYLYGGGFSEGSAAVPVYDGEGLAKKGLVVVTINYRVGVLGFLAHPELTKESDHQASGNYGLLDQIAALRWVRGNIAHFGGDENRVTVAGQSAGGVSVHDLTASPLAKGLFQRAIVESGGSSIDRSALGAARTLAQAEDDGRKFAESKGAGSINSINSINSIKDLRAMSWQKVTESSPGLRYAPIVDGYSLPGPVRMQNDVVMLTGANVGELGGLGPPPAPMTAEKFRSQARQRYGAAADEFLKLYPADTDEAARMSQSRSVRDQALVSMYLWARERSKTARTRVYEYLWDHALPGPDAERYGAFHTSEVPYVMNTLNMSDRPFTDADRKIAGMMSSYWTNFAATGDPNGKGLAAWPAVGERPEVMEVGDKTELIPVAGSEAKFKFFEAFFTNR
jgi:para-nitrobenzyl esterase